MEVTAGLEPAKTGFADQRLDHFGIATSVVRHLCAMAVDGSRPTPSGIKRRIRFHLVSAKG